MMFVILLLMIGVVGAFQPPSALTRKRYDGYTVLNVTPVDQDALDMLQQLMFTDNNVDFWREPSKIGIETHVMVPPEHLPRIEVILSAANVVYRTQVDDVQNLLTPMWNKIDSRTMTSDKLPFNIDDFNTLDDINSWMTSLIGSCRTGLVCEIYNAGNSFEGRPINVFKISKPGNNRKAFYIDSTIHGREWLSTATTLKILNRLATGGDADAIALTDAYDWYVMPVLNPDGYVFSWTDDRLWRKNRRLNVGSFCFGVDLNRNFNFRWGTEGVGFNPCSEIYCGVSGGSEYEAEAVSLELVRLGPSLVAFLTVQAYGSEISFSYGTTVNGAGEVCERTNDYDELLRVAEATADAIQTTYDSIWSRGNGCELAYALSGQNVDFAKEEAGIKYSYGALVRGDNYVVDASNIDLSFREVWNGIVALNNAINV